MPESTMSVDSDLASIFLTLKACPVCYSTSFNPLYQNLEDRVFGTTIKTSLDQCLDCTALFQNPQIKPDHIGLAYQEYYTHAPSNSGNQPAPETPSMGTRLKQIIKSISFLRKVVLYYFHTRADAPLSAAAKRYSYVKQISFLEHLLGSTPLQREIGNCSLMYLKPQLQGRLLDYGCGSGDFLDRMSRYGWECFGVEFDSKAFDHAYQRCVNAKLYLGGIEQLAQFPENYFDAITVGGVIEHVHYPRELIQEFFRVLRPQGKLIILTPNSEGYGHKKFRANWRGLEPPRHLVLFNKKSIESICQKISFTELSISTSGELNPYIWGMSREIEQGLRLNFRVPRMKYRIEAVFAYYLLWLLGKCGPFEKDTLKVIATK